MTRIWTSASPIHQALKNWMGCLWINKHTLRYQCGRTAIQNTAWPIDRITQLHERRAVNREAGVRTPDGPETTRCLCYFSFPFFLRSNFTLMFHSLQTCRVFYDVLFYCFSFFDRGWPPFIFPPKRTPSNLHHQRTSPIELRVVSPAKLESKSCDTKVGSLIWEEWFSMF